MSYNIIKVIKETSQLAGKAYEDSNYTVKMYRHMHKTETVGQSS